MHLPQIIGYCSFIDPKVYDLLIEALVAISWILTKFVWLLVRSDNFDAKHEEQDPCRNMFRPLRCCELHEPLLELKEVPKEILHWHILLNTVEQESTTAE